MPRSRWREYPVVRASSSEPPGRSLFERSKGPTGAFFFVRVFRRGGILAQQGCIPSAAKRWVSYLRTLASSSLRRCAPRPSACGFIRVIQKRSGGPEPEGLGRASSFNGGGLGRGACELGRVVLPGRGRRGGRLPGRFHGSKMLSLWRSRHWGSVVR